MKVNNPKIPPKCDCCGNKRNISYGFFSMGFPDEKLEKLIDKFGRDDWWKKLEENNTPEENEILDKLVCYDQFLNTVGRSYRCEGCIEKETKLLDKYYK